MGHPTVPRRGGLPRMLTGVLVGLWGAAACGAPDPAPDAGSGDAAAAEVGARETAEVGARETGYRGVALAEPLEKPDFVLRDTEGRPFRFRQETEGRLTLLFFGYTHCPDVCPVQLANLAAVLGDLPHRDRRRIRVVFVTTDPERDTPERLRAWLDGFDPAFVGLRGSRERVNGIQRSLDLPPAVRQPASGPGPGEGDYTVGHASQVIAFTADGRGRVVYPFGIRQADWARDLPRLLRFRPTDATAGGS